MEIFFLWEKFLFRVNKKQMIETYRFRIYPTEDQKVLLAKHFGTVRFVYNWALEYNTRMYA